MPDKVKHTLDPNKWISQYADYLYNYAITRVDGQEIAKVIRNMIKKSADKAMATFLAMDEDKNPLILLGLLNRKQIYQFHKFFEALFE